MTTTYLIQGAAGQVVVITTQDSAIFRKLRLPWFPVISVLSVKSDLLKHGGDKKDTTEG